MKLVSIGFVVTAMLLSAGPGGANVLHMRGHFSSYSANELSRVDATPVNRGQSLAVACECLGPHGANVRVVMSLDSVKGEEPTGFEAVLLTGEMIKGNAVRVRVPDMPDLVNHTVTLKVYITSSNGTTACNVGRLRIV